MKLNFPSVCVAVPLIALLSACASKPVVQASPANPVRTIVGAGAAAPTAAPPAVAVAPVAAAPTAATPTAAPPIAAPASPAPTQSVAAVASSNYQPETGLYRCEEKQTVAVKRVMDDGKKVVINWKAKDYDLALLPTNSGAIRYENKTAGYAWIYVVGKAFLLDSKKGNRIANDCKI